MSADTRPIAPARFASALKELSLPMLHLKVLEIRNSIAHLQYSNDQLQPFADGSATASSNSTSADSSAAAPDQDCIDAIAENLAVIDRMAERIALVRAEVEERGMSWTEFQSAEEVKASQETVTADETSDAAAATTNGEQPERHSAWTDGTFQTGVIRNGEVHMDETPGQRQGQGASATTEEHEGAGGQGQGQGGGSLSDDQLRRAMEERMRNLGTDDDENDGGMHL